MRQMIRSEIGSALSGKIAKQAKVLICSLVLAAFGLLALDCHESEARSTSSRSSCKGVCYGVTSKKTGRARNNYVRGYTKKDGTYVAPYTRSDYDILMTTSPLKG